MFHPFSLTQIILRRIFVLVAGLLYMSSRTIRINHD